MNTIQQYFYSYSILMMFFFTPHCLLGMDIEPCIEEVSRMQIHKEIAKLDKDPNGSLLPDENQVDLQQIKQLLLQTKNSSDGKKLVILHDPFLTQTLKADISAGRIFIARDALLDRKNNIISVIKVFVVENSEEKDHLLRDVLRALPSIHHEEYNNNFALLRHGIFSSNYNEDSPTTGGVYNYEDANSIQNKVLTNNERPTEEFFSQSTMVYIGMACTINAKMRTCGSQTMIRHYRGLGVNTSLEKYAFLHLQSKIIDNIRKNNSTFYIVGYGVILENLHYLMHIRNTLTSSQHLKASLQIPNFKLNSDCSVDYYDYYLQKPAFDETNTNVLTLLPQDHPNCLEGVGRLLVTKIPQS